MCCIISCNISSFLTRIPLPGGAAIAARQLRYPKVSFKGLGRLSFARKRLLLVWNFPANLSTSTHQAVQVLKQLHFGSRNARHNPPVQSCSRNIPSRDSHGSVLALFLLACSFPVLPPSLSPSFLPFSPLFASFRRLRFGESQSICAVRSAADMPRPQQVLN